jgi:dTDP-4-dehydrorhamnose 3,5-epimerase
MYNVYGNMPFTFRKLDMDGLVLITPNVFGDGRGYFAEIYKHSEFKKNRIDRVFVQDSHSMSKKGVLRGLHYQLRPVEQGKIIRVIGGEIFDVAVDIRKGSQSYGKWFGTRLSEENRFMLFIPPGFAHGFVTLKDNTEILYKMTNEYSKKHERGIIWNDPEINIKWPIKNPVVSDKDTKFPRLEHADNNFKFS